MVQIAPSGYYRHAARARQPELRSIRDRQDELLSIEIQRVWDDNMQCYGVVKVWKQLHRERINIARCTVQRLMRRLGLQGVRRGQIIRTTVPDGKIVCPLDKVNRQFHASRPNELWGLRLYLRFNVAGLAVRGLRDRCLCTTNRWLARQQQHED